MSLQASLIRAAIRLTPMSLVAWAGNFVLKGIAHLCEIQFDLDQRKVYVRTLLEGEAEPIQVWLEDFALIRDGEDYSIILREARSNKVWLSNLLARVTGRAWKLPALPPLRPYMGLANELLGEKPRG